MLTMTATFTDLSKCKVTSRCCVSYSHEGCTFQLCFKREISVHGKEFRDVKDLQNFVDANPENLDIKYSVTNDALGDDVQYDLNHINKLPNDLIVKLIGQSLLIKQTLSNLNYEVGHYVS